MQKYASVVQDKTGRAIKGASVLVKKSDNSSATIYSDNGGTVIPGATITTDGFGGFAFYAADGRYNLYVSVGASQVGQLLDVLLEDPADGSPININGGSVTNSAITGGTMAGTALSTITLDGIVIAGGDVAKYSRLDDADGSNLIFFIQLGTGAVARPVQDVLRESNHSIWNYFLASESTAEGMINRAIQAHNRVHIPAGVYNIDASVGITVKTGLTLTGDGKNKTILNAVLGTGATLANIALYNGGSVIKRAFNPAAPNAYVNDVYIADIGIVLNHPLAAITTTDIQIGFDLRNITASTIERCHSGNIPPVGGPIAPKVASKAFLVQGYGYVCGTVSGGDPAYAGGEKNRILNSSMYGAYKGVIQDDPALSGSSASYGTVVCDCDIQTAHWLIGQMGQYGAGNTHVRNILQDINKKSGDASNSYIMYYDGFNNRVSPAYIEGGSAVDYQVYLDTDANNNVVDLTMAGVSSGTGLITDNSNTDSKNYIRYFGTNGISALIELYNKAYKNHWVKFHWDGVSAVVIDGFGGSVTAPGVSRTGVGDYTVTWALPFASANHYMPTVKMDTNASANGGMDTYQSHTSSNLRVRTYSQNGATSTLIDPRFVWAGASQS